MVEEGWRWWRQVAFMDVVAAYEILGDPDKRAAFDDMGGSEQAPPPLPPLHLSVSLTHIM